MFSYKDAIDHAIAFLGSEATAQSLRDAHQAALTAYRVLNTAHRWSFYYKRGRLTTVAPYSTGTVSFDMTGGTYERMLTLASGTWPTWATFGVIAISGVSYEVAEYKSSSIITLSANNNPGADVAALTTYTLYRDTWPVPTDFLAMDRLVNVTTSFGMRYEHPREWLNRQQVYIGPSTPSIFTVVGDDNYLNQLCIKIFPAPDQQYQFDYLYQRRPRPLLVDEYKAGTVTTASTTVTGTSTAFAQRHVGSVIRMGDATNYPTGLTGLNPYLEERTVMSVESATSLTVDSAWSDSYTGVKYVISDVVDVEEGAMLTAYQRCIELQCATTRRMDKSLPSITAMWIAELKNAMAADSRSFERRTAGGSPWYGRLANFPSGDDLGTT